MRCWFVFNSDFDVVDVVMGNEMECLVKFVCVRLFVFWVFMCSFFFCIFWGWNKIFYCVCLFIVICASVLILFILFLNFGFFLDSSDGLGYLSLRMQEVFYPVLNQMLELINLTFNNVSFHESHYHLMNFANRWTWRRKLSDLANNTM